MKKLKFCVIHCTATNRDVTKEEIVLWHTAPVSKGGRGWSKVGYSKLVRTDGSVESFVEENNDNYVDAWEITNGVVGINAEARHIVYAGGLDAKNKPRDTRTEAQRLSLERLVKELIGRFPDILIAGHYDFAAKACPSFNVAKWLEEIKVPEKNIYRKGI